MKLSGPPVRQRARLVSFLARIHHNPQRLSLEAFLTMMKGERKRDMRDATQHAQQQQQWCCLPGKSVLFVWLLPLYIPIGEK